VNNLALDALLLINHEEGQANEDRFRRPPADPRGGALSALDGDRVIPASASLNILDAYTSICSLTSYD
jgi:hypothetical protein